MYYHVSKIDHGKEFTFKPKVPESALFTTEGNIPRVCVCPNVFYCLRAICSCSPITVGDALLGMNNDDDFVYPFVVYATEEVPFLPPKASDFRLNKEHWFLKDITMKRVGYISIIDLIYADVTVSDFYQKLSKDYLKQFDNRKGINILKNDALAFC